MISDLKSQKMKLIIPSVQLIEVEDGIILRRGSVQLKIGGAGASQAVHLILAAASKNEGTREEICSSFPPALHSAVDALIARLISSRFMVAVNGDDKLTHVENNLDVFYWNFCSATADVIKRFNKVDISIMGVNYISSHLAQSLKKSGVASFHVVDIPPLRNKKLLLSEEWSTDAQRPVDFEQWKACKRSSSLHCLLGTSEFGNTEYMRELNRICIENKWHFLPVILSDLIGYVGPFVIPGETACYECLQARQNSNAENYADLRATESVAFDAQSVIGFHPSMTSMLADLAVLELVKVYGEVLPNRKVGSLITLKLLVPELTCQQVLKIPRCIACSPLLNRSSFAFKKDKSVRISGAK